MARPRKPSRQLKYEGSQEKRKLPEEAEPLSSSTCPDPPEWLDPDAQAFWCAVAPELWRTGLLTILDVDALSLAATAFASWKECVEFISEKGQVYDTTTTFGAHVWKEYPQVKWAKQHADTYHKFMREFGLSPAARSGLAISVTREGENPWGDLV